MCCPVFGSVSTVCSNFCSSLVENPVVSKVSAFAKSIFDGIGRFTSGFLLGAAAITCSIVFGPSSLVYALEPRLIPVAAISGGIVFGLLAMTGSSF